MKSGSDAAPAVQHISWKAGQWAAPPEAGLAGFSASPVLTNKTAKTEENFLGYSPDFKVLKSLVGKPTP